MLPHKSLDIRVSIDVGCYQHSVAVGLSTGELIDEFEIDHNQQGFDRFFDKIHDIESRYLAPVSVAMEGYNGWARPLDQHILSHGYTLFNINNLKLARFKEVFPSAAKTDAIDARKGLELFTLSDHLPLAKNCLQRIEKPDQINIKLKRYSRRRRRLVDEKVRIKGAMHSDLQSISPELLSLTKNIDQSWFLNLLTSVTELSQLAKKQQRSLAKIKGVGTRYLARIKEWQQVASFSEDISWVSPMLIEDAYKMLELRALIKSLDDTMEALCEESEIGRLLNTIPGFGKTSCAELAGEIDDVRRFESEASLAMYLGMAPLDNASGVYRGSKSPKQINRRAKKAMMTAVDRHRANVTESQVFYDKKRKQGKKHNQSVRALGRYLTKVIFKMLIENRAYEIRLI
jgi:transposase